MSALVIIRIIRNEKITIVERVPINPHSSPIVLKIKSVCCLGTKFPLVWVPSKKPVPKNPPLLNALSNGGFFGTGFLEGTQTKGNFVPRQHTDFIFSTIGEEWGFIGTLSTIVIFSFLIIRIITRADKQPNHFRRIYSYCFASLIFFHFFLNVGMSIGLIPSIGIPLPFISYGGSSLLIFSLMFFVYLNFDSSRLKES